MKFLGRRGDVHHLDLSAQRLNTDDARATAQVHPLCREFAPNGGPSQVEEPGNLAEAAQEPHRSTTVTIRSISSGLEPKSRHCEISERQDLRVLVVDAESSRCASFGIEDPSKPAPLPLGVFHWLQQDLDRLVGRPAVCSYSLHWRARVRKGEPLCRHAETLKIKRSSIERRHVLQGEPELVQDVGLLRLPFH